jgi:hypothetical protein
MRKIGIGFAMAALAAVPAPAVQQDEAEVATPTPPRTVHSELLLFRDTAYNGEEWVVEDPSSRVRTDWPIRSLAIHPGDRWQICARPRFRDPCIVLDRSVHDATLIGVEDQIGSARLASDEGGE